jgi:monovalent cation:proton antiporter-2 (CPA2) family protein
MELSQAALLLVAAVVAVPLFRRLKLGAILGYLAAGVVMGPAVFGVIHDVEHIFHFSELGVVFFLFLVGLELEPKRLWQLRKAVFGLGAAQLVVTASLLTPLIVLLLGAPLRAALIAACGLALSSTAIALQLLAERGQVASPSGRAGFSMLLFQDLAIVPLLALVPLLAGGDMGTPTEALLSFLKVIGMTLAIVIGGRFLMRPLFKFIAQSKTHEISTAVAILIVIGGGILMSFVGMSMGMGAFLAGVLLADSEYRHELEAAVEPFKGLLLGLFFMSIGMSLNIGLVAAEPVFVVALTLGLMVIKAGILIAIGVASKFDPRERTLMAVALSQGGEFAFVLFGVAATAAVMTREVSQLLTVVVSMSMALTPLFMLACDRIVTALFAKKLERDFDKLDDEASNAVIIAGFGRYGQIIARILTLNKVGFTALEISPDQVDFVRKFGNKLYYGDASRLDLLRSAKADQAQIFVLAIDDPEASLRTAAVVKRAFPHLPIYARARNRNHVYKLRDLGVHVLNRETLLSSLQMAEEVLVGLGVPRDTAQDRVEKFRVADEDLLLRQQAVHTDQQKLIQTARQYNEELKALFEQDLTASSDPLPEPPPLPDEPAPR